VEISINFFPGDDDKKSELEREDNEFTNNDLAQLWDFQRRSINAITRVAKSTQKKPATNEFKNPYEGDPAARQLNESVDEFLKRMPVLNHTFVGPWLWITNFISGGQTFDEDHNSSKVSGFIKKGQILLQEYHDKKALLEREFPNLTAGGITRRLGPEREKLKTDILQAAESCEVLVGKVWIFPSTRLTDVANVCSGFSSRKTSIHLTYGTKYAMLWPKIDLV
jgi:Domain of unknown function (DUF1917)